MPPPTAKLASEVPEAPHDVRRTAPLPRDVGSGRGAPPAAARDAADREPPRSASAPTAAPPPTPAASTSPASTASASTAAPPPAGSPSIVPLAIEVVWGRDRRKHVVPPAGATIGSTAVSEVCVPAAFLAQQHARLSIVDGQWVVTAIAPGGAVLIHGRPVVSAPVVPGDVFRLADRIGNFVTVRVELGSHSRLREGALRVVLPGPGDSYLIGRDPTCAVRLDHPLVQRRHAAVRRDHGGTLWLEDRATAAGTYVNGQRLNGHCRLQMGDTVQIGPFSARVGTTALEPLEQVAGVAIDVARAGIRVPVGRSGAEQNLIESISLRLEPASLTAVIGPSGAGKTTLMRLLSGQLSSTSGSVTYNGVDVGECRQAYAELMGFVPQDDVVHADLTVDEALAYQATLRLGGNVDESVRRARIDELVLTLGLSSQRAQLVRTLSGGQRKRVSIACELLREPQLLFLDEPTSGLDPGLDKRMMLLLRLLADQGRTVVLTTHAIAHVDVCDSLVLLGPGGHMVFAGPPSAALDWFRVSSIGDIFSMVDSTEAARQVATRFDAETSHASAAGPPEPAATPPARPEPAKSRPPAGSAAWRKGVRQQLTMFTRRYATLVSRDRGALVFTLLQGVVVAILTALVAPSPFHWARNGNSAVFVFGCAAVWFGMISAVREIVKERHIWRREFMAGGNTSAYLGSKLVVLAGFALFQALTLTLVIAMTLGLPTASPVGEPFLSIFVDLWLANICGMSVGLLVSATSASADRAVSIVPYLLIAQLVLCGVLFKLGAMTFVAWLMPAHWSVSALGGIAGLSAAHLRQSSGLYPHSAAGLLGSWFVLLVLTAVCVAGTVWALNRQARSWSTGSDSPPPLRFAALTFARKVLQGSAHVDLGYGEQAAPDAVPERGQDG